MRNATALLLVAGLLPFGSRQAKAQNTALTVSGPPISMTIVPPGAGNPLAPVTNSTNSYFVLVKNAAGVKKITAQLDLPMPPFTTLSINMVAPFGATALGPVNLTTTSQDIVVNLAKVNPGSSQGITYVFSATVLAGVIATQSRTVLLTLLDYP